MALNKKLIRCRKIARYRNSSVKLEARQTVHMIYEPRLTIEALKTGSDLDQARVLRCDIQLFPSGRGKQLENCFYFTVSSLHEGIISQPQEHTCALWKVLETVVP